MMRKTICRTMATSTITAHRLTIVDGQPVVETLNPIVVMGKAKEKDALKAVKDVHGDLAGVTIGKIDVAEDTYEISVDDFVKYATKVTNNSEETESVSEGYENNSEVSEATN